ncbi:uncharacterized protein [Musca autumnalis]|uniref:uncharacterized protein n=1 Tax=Musca autumnalis TaxID=221902 RepID=UPI003CF68B55
MKIVAFVVVTLLGLLIGLANAEARRCERPCPRIYRPVCGRLGSFRGGLVSQCTFANLCIYEVHKCKTSQNWTYTPGACRTTQNCRNIGRN